MNDINESMKSLSQEEMLTSIEISSSGRLLASTFVPGNFDVICGRGSKCFNHHGNKIFRKLVEDNLNRYSAALTKHGKTSIIYEVINHVRKCSPNGGFIKLDLLSGRYYEVGDFSAREKTSQAFRDVLHDQYKSSYSQRNCDRKKRRQKTQYSTSAPDTQQSSQDLTSLCDASRKEETRISSTDKSSSIGHCMPSSGLPPMSHQDPFRINRLYGENDRFNVVSSSMGIETETANNFEHGPPKTAMQHNLLQQPSISEVNSKFQSSLSKSSDSLNHPQLSSDNVVNIQWKLPVEKNWYTKPTPSFDYLIDNISVTPINDDIDYLLQAECDSLLGTSPNTERKDSCTLSKATVCTNNETTSNHADAFAFQQFMKLREKTKCVSSLEPDPLPEQS